MINKERLLAVTDGIIAIAATIMVLELAVPAIISAKNILAQWPVLLAYVISFLHIFLAWHQHHDALVNAKKIDHRVFLMNALWLLFVTLLPFATGLIGKAPNNRLAVGIYLAVLLLMEITIKLVCDMLVKLNNHEIVDAKIIAFLRKVSFLGIGVSAVCCIFLPILALGVSLGFTITCIILLVRYDIRMAEKRAKLEEKE